jgi:hypothetical protein
MLAAGPRFSSLCLLGAASLACACAEVPETQEGDPDTLPSYAESADIELRLARASLEPYRTAVYEDAVFAHGNRARSACSRALIMAVDTIGADGAIDSTHPAVAEVRALARQMRVPGMDAPPLSWTSNGQVWLAAAPGVDCLLATSLVWDGLESSADKDTLIKGFSALAAILKAAPVKDGSPDFRFTRAGMEQLQSENRGDTKEEEAAIAGEYFWLASQLLPPSEDSAKWAADADELLLYALSNEGDNQPFQPGKSTTANHQMSPSTYYTVGGLISYADLRAVRGGLEAGVSTLELPEERILAILAANDPFIQVNGTRDYHYHGKFQLVKSSGEPAFDGDPENGSPYAFDSLVTTLPRVYPEGSELLIPTSGLKTLVEYRNPAAGAAGEVWRYQLDETSAAGPAHYEVRAFRCWPEPALLGEEPASGKPVQHCDARFKNTLEGQLAGLNALLGAKPVPTDEGVDAWPQYFGVDGKIHGTMFIGDQAWRYVCDPTKDPVTCAGDGSQSLEDYFGRFQKTDDYPDGWTSPPPAKLRAASIFQQSDGLIRYYFYSDTHVWASRCQGDELSTCQQMFVKTIEAQFSPLDASFESKGAAPLPTDGIDAITQYESSYTDAGGGFVFELTTHVVKGDTLWEYTCTGSQSPVCAASFARKLFDEWSRIEHQERWLAQDEVFARTTGVADWGVTATMMNSVYALGAALGAKQPYAELLSIEMDEREDGQDGLRAMLHSAYDPQAKAWTWAPQDRTPPDRLDYMADGWRWFDGNHLADEPKTRTSRIASHLWFNLFAGRNHAIAYLLLGDQKVFRTLDP